MYNNFFGFKERPFQLVPNPAYFFLSRSHEEAMAHLIFAISQGDGFVEITGEVGTGKTTLCRAFLNDLGKGIEVAYIFNPKMDSIQLLKAINDEFGIPSEKNDAKGLIDSLNAFLLRKKAEGQQAILVIDEAQNLSYDVLEQLRLLSNLETNTNKLLQIILLGQPELSDMLDSYELRQLAQRITLSCHLTPLSYQETCEYIRYRLQVASHKLSVAFHSAACRAVYQYSGGIPRLINIASDRALLTAYGLNKTRITGSIAKASIRELSGRGEMKGSFQEGRRGLLFIASCFALFTAFLCVISLAVIFYLPRNASFRSLVTTEETGKPAVTQKVPVFTKPPEKSAPDPAPIKEGDEPLVQNPQVIEGRKELAAGEKGSFPEGERSVAAREFKDVLREANPRSSRGTALMTALGLWNEKPEVSLLIQEVEEDQAFFKLGAKQNGLRVQRIEGSIDVLRRLNYPAILEFRMPEDLEPRYLTLTKIHDSRVVLKGEIKDRVMEVDRDHLEPYWSRVAYLLWKDFLIYPGTISANASQESIVALKKFMADIGYNDIEINPTYDTKTIETVKRIQEKHGIYIDGIVGPVTKMVLYNEKPLLRIPHVAD